MNRTDRWATDRWMRGCAVVFLLLFVVMSSGCQFVQNEFWNY